MNSSFEYYYRQLSRATVVVLFLGLTSFGLALVSALLGFPNAVISFNGATLSIAYVFVVLLALFLVSSVVAGLLRWMDRRPAPVKSK